MTEESGFQVVAHSSIHFQNQVYRSLDPFAQATVEARRVLPRICHGLVVRLAVRTGSELA